MEVKLISVTQSNLTINGKLLSPEELIVYTGRVSSPTNQPNIETSSKLIKYLIKHKHWSVFTMVDFTVEIITSRAIAAQILRHKSSDFQEFSQRYSEVTSFEQYEARRQDQKNRQNSINDLPQETKDFFNEAQKQIQELSLSLYNQALNKEIAKECCRFLLPMSATTKIYMKNSVRGWIHYLQARTDVSSQLEHREIAEAIKNQIFTLIFPNIAKAIFDDNL